MAGSFYSTVDESNFLLPDMGDYYDENLIENFINNIKNNSNESAAYYIEEPFTTSLGYFPEYEAFVISATPQIAKYDTDNNNIGCKNEDLNTIDGDTAYFYIDSIKDGGRSFTINGTSYNSFKDYIYSNVTPNTFNSNSFIARLVGIDAPEISHYSIIPYSKEDYNKNNGIVSMTIKRAKAENIEVVYDKSKDRSDNEIAKFIYYNENKNKLVEIVDTFNTYPYELNRVNKFIQTYFNTIDQYTQEININDNNIMYLKIVTSSNIDNNSKEDGIKAKNYMNYLLKKASDIRIVVDANNIQWKGYAEGPYHIDYGIFSLDGLWKYIKDLWNKLFSHNEYYIYGGFNGFGQDSYRRFLSSIYVKVQLDSQTEEVWVNVAKYIKAMVGDNVKLNLGVSPNDLSNNNGLSPAFKLWTYDSNKFKYMDAFLEESQMDFDDRKSIQQSITNLDYDSCKEYTVIIGDCLFMVPPTSIRMVNQSESERISLIRSKGTMVKQKPNNERSLELTLYFNNDVGINGYPVTRNLPNGESVTYYMNGLRSLLAMFKVTPFLPIENEYINEVLNIDAVSLQNIQIQTMPSYPKCLAVTLLMQQFNYRAYLNELPVPNPDNGEDFNKNMFSATINYEVMRYYYQRLIQRGEDIKNIDTLSNEYIHKTLGNRSSLIPMTFENQNIEFYILDEAWLDSLLTIKELSEKQTLNQVSEINDATKEWAKQVGLSFAKILSVILNKEMPSNLNDNNKVNKYINDLNKKLFISYQCPKLNKIYLKRNNGKYSLAFAFNLDNITETEFENLIKSVKLQLDIDQSKSCNFNNGIMYFPITTNKNKNSIDINSNEYKVAEFFAYRSGKTVNNENLKDVDTDDWDKFTTNINTEAMQNAKDNAIDLDTYLTAKFINYPLDIIVQQITLSLANTFANTKLKAYDGVAPQYCGGQDTIIEVSFQTQNKEVISALNALQSIATDYLIKYKKILNCWPVRINCELTRLCGINEVLIESIGVETVPNYPGLYNVTCRMISVDRTMRNKEALKRLDTINNSGAINASGVASVVYKTYFDFNNVLSKTEVYPDLELPTIDELEQCGFKYIQYSFNKGSRIYPDPDFYFVYAYTYSSQMVRKMIVDYFNSITGDNNVDNEYSLVDDNTAQRVNIRLTKEDDLQYSIEYANQALYNSYSLTVDNLDEQLNSMKENEKKEFEQVQEAINDVNTTFNTMQQIEEEILSNTSKSWDIGKNLKCYLGNISYKFSKTSEVTKELNNVTNKIINMIDKELSNPITPLNWNKKTKDERYFFEDFIKDVDNYVDDNLSSKKIWYKILKTSGLLNDKASISNNVKKVVKGLYIAAAMALSGDAEYDDNADKTSYYPKAYRSFNKNIVSSKRWLEFTLSVSSISPDLSWTDDNSNVIPNVEIIDNNGQNYTANSTKDIYKNGIAFGEYQIRKYPADYLRNFYNTVLDFDSYDFIDPYYNKALHYSLYNKELSEDEYKEYEKNILTYSFYSIEAFNRIVLIWVKRLLENKIYLNYIDLRRDDIVKQFNELIEYYQDTPLTKILGENTSNEQTENVQNIIGSVVTFGEENRNALFEANTDAVIAGKIFMAMVCAVTHGDSYIYGDMLSYNITSLNSKVASCQNEIDLKTNPSSGERFFRKFVRAFCDKDVKISDSFDKLTTSSKTSLETTMQDNIERLWVSASNNPTVWIMHSFYDMIVNNKRGRMCRAFPTFYMMLVDEGREIGYWKLHDNFYNISAISEIQITKSRKIPADTAKITMTNMYKTYTTDDEDLRTDYENNLSDVWESIFNPHAYYEEVETKRQQQMDMNRVKLKPGVRIHIRMGYSGDASNLPIVFNGVIAEVGTGELMEIIAQGDGHELSNTDAFSSATAEDLAEIQNENLITIAKWITNFFTAGATPKELINNILTTKSGSFTKKFLNWFSNGRFFNDNMFGIVNFGEIDYKEIHSNGEVMQNIYEAEGGMPWTQQVTTSSSANLHSDVNPPEFTIELKDKSPWDVLNVCASSSLDFITGLAPFGIRSTIFFGRPHYYYAYDYAIDDNGRILEKRKPFQQYHLIDSYSDIIANNISASATQIRTCGVGIYKGPNFINKTVEKRLPSPLWIDFDIYPEYQKTITVDTQMTFKGNKLGFLFYNYAKNEWSEDGGQKIAWRMTARALKDSVKDMYQGEVIVFGDPAIKPYDRVYLYDIYEDMNGSVEVEAIVHNFSTENGFTSSIYVDCISTIDNRYEQVGQIVSKNLLGEIALTKATIYAFNRVFNTTTKPLLNTIAKTMVGGVTKSAKAVNFAAKLINQDDLIKYSSLENWSETFLKTLGLTSSDISIWDSINSLYKYKDLISKIDTTSINNADDVFRVLDNLVNTANKLDVDDMASILNDLKTSNRINTSYADDIDKLINALTSNSPKISQSIDNVMRTSSNEILKLLSDNGTKLDDVGMKAVSNISKYLANDNISVEDAKNMMNDIGILINKTDGLYEDKKLLDTIFKYNDNLYDIYNAIDDAADIARVKNGLSLSTLSIAGGPIATIATMAIEFVLEYVLTKSVYNWIENKLASFNVLQIYPLKKNGIAYVAGLDGHKGLVVGSSSYNKQGIIDQFVNWAFKDRGTIFNIAKSLLVSENMQLIIDTYYSRNNLGEYSGETGKSEVSINDMLSSMAYEEASNYSTYKSLAALKRVSNLDSDDAKDAFYKTRITLETDLASNSQVLNELIPVTKENNLLSDYFSNGTLKIAHDIYSKLEQNNISNVDKISYTFDTKECGKVRTYGICIGTDNEPAIDIPFLRQDAFYVFHKILQDTIDELGVIKPGEKPSRTMYLLSATIAGANKWNSTGYVFKFYVSNCDDIVDRVIKIKNSIDEIYKNIMKDSNNTVMQYKLRDSGNIEIFIAPRILTKQYTKNKSETDNKN